MTAEWIKIKVAGKEMRCYLCRPDDAKPAPALLVLQEVFGVNSHIQEVTERLAKEGYVALAPELFHRTAPEGWTGKYTDRQAFMPHMQAIKADDLIADLKAGADFLESRAFVKKDALAAIGFCLGGRAAYLANTALKLKAAVSFYGGNIPPWLDRVKSVSAPNLFFWGGKDGHIDAAQRDQVTSAFAQEGKDYVSTVFSFADHGFFCSERASYHPVAAEQAWALTKEFLRNGFEG